VGVNMQQTKTMEMKRLFLLTSLLFFFQTLCAQKYYVGDFNISENDSLITVSFKLLINQPIDLGMFVLIDSTPPWITCKSIEGNLERQKAGNKSIIWNYVRDGFSPDSLLKSDLRFIIREV
jgi:hypothetical protein